MNTAMQKLLNYLEQRTDDWKTELVLVDTVKKIKSLLPIERKQIKQAHKVAQKHIIYMYEEGIDNKSLKDINDAADDYYTKTFNPQH